MISKLMTEDDADAEMTGYKILEKIDPNHMYYPGPPQACDANPADPSIADSECSILDENPNVKEYRLLFYKDGGIDLDDFVEDHLDAYLKTNPQRQTDLFFLNAHHLLRGLKLYINNNFIHHDIKPSNIVFNQKTYTFNYIDFGLSVVASELIKDIMAKKDYESFHWSYPMELGFTNFKKNYYFPKLTNEKIDKIEKDFVSMFNNPEPHLKNDYKIKPTRYTNTTFRYMANQLQGFNLPAAVKSTMDGIKHYKQQSFEKFVNDTVPYLDIYALGFTMNHMVNFFFAKNAVTKEQYARYSALFSSMYEFDCSKRLTDIDTIMTEYEKILEKTGVLKRLGKKFDRHEIVGSAQTLKDCHGAKNRKTSKCKK
jgi:serine/threonine protein kinase